VYQFCTNEGVGGEVADSPTHILPPDISKHVFRRHRQRIRDVPLTGATSASVSIGSTISIPKIAFGDSLVDSRWTRISNEIDGGVWMTGPH
jgi:hypothetical protein